jgi:hypothetical protein
MLKATDLMTVDEICAGEGSMGHDSDHLTHAANKGAIGFTSDNASDEIGNSCALNGGGNLLVKEAAAQRASVSIISASALSSCRSQTRHQRGISSVTTLLQYTKSGIVDHRMLRLHEARQVLLQVIKHGTAAWGSQSPLVAGHQLDLALVLLQLGECSLKGSGEVSW